VTVGGVASNAPSTGSAPPADANTNAHRLSPQAQWERRSRSAGRTSARARAQAW
jgi:hypothetical protein